MSRDICPENYSRHENVIININYKENIGGNNIILVLKYYIKKSIEL